MLQFARLAGKICHVNAPRIGVLSRAVYGKGSWQSLASTRPYSDPPRKSPENVADTTFQQNQNADSSLPEYSLREAVGALGYAHSSPTSDINHMLEVIQQKLSDLPLGQVVSLDSSLQRGYLEKFPLSEAIRSALPSVVEDGFNQRKLGALHVYQKIGLLLYIARTQYELRNKSDCIDAIAADLCKYADNLDVKQQKQILYALDQLARSKSECVYSEDINRLIESITEKLVGCFDDLTFVDVIHLCKNYGILYNIVRDPRVIHKFCAEVASGWNECTLPQLISLQNRLYSMDFFDKRLLDQLEAVIGMAPDEVPKARSKTLIRLMQCFEPIADRSEKWHRSIWPLINRSLAFDEHAEAFPEIALTQITLGCPSKSHIEVVLSKEYLEEYVLPELNDDAGYAPRSLRTIYWYALRAEKRDAIKYRITGTEQLKAIFEHLQRNHEPMVEVVANEIGVGKYLNRVAMDHGAVMDVIKVNRKTGELTDIRLKDESLRDADNVIPVDMIVVEPDEQLFRVRCPPRKYFVGKSPHQELAMRSKLINELSESLFIPVVQIDRSAVYLMAKEQRRPYIEAQIRAKLDSLNAA